MPWQLEIDVRESSAGSTRRAIDTFTRVNTTDSYDAVAATFELDFLFDPNDKNHAEIAGVSHYHEANIYYVHENGFKELYLRGYVLSQSFQSSATPTNVKISGFSKAGIIEDCDIPPDVELETSGLTIADIARRILSKFGGKKGLKLVVAASGANTVVPEKEQEDVEEDEIEKTTAETSRNIKSYLADLCSRKNIVLSHTREGDLLVTKANTDGEPIFEIDLDRGDKPYGFEDMQLVYNGQRIFSDITVIRQADDEDGNAAEHTIKNPLCPVVYRPKVITLSGGDDISIEEAAQNALCEHLKAITLTITMSKIAYNNKLLAINNTIVVRQRAIFLYEKTKWFIQNVQFNVEADKEEAVLTCVLPWVYNYNAKNLGLPGKPKYGPYNVFIDPHHNLPNV